MIRIRRFIGLLNPLKSFRNFRWTALAANLLRSFESEIVEVRRQVGVVIKVVLSKLVKGLKYLASKLTYVFEYPERLQVRLAAAKKERLEREEAARRALENEARQARYETSRARFGGGFTSRGAAGTRMPRDRDDFESVCAEYARSIGYPDASRTPQGPDGGIDVISGRMVGQCKYHVADKVTAKDVRPIFASKVERGKNEALFFHLGAGYSQDAKSAAQNLGVKLYELDPKTGRMRLVT